MQVDLKGKVALVTGGARDIGRAVSLALAESGASVAINYYASADRATSVVREIESRGRAIAVRADVTSSTEVNSMIDTIAHELGSRIDILVNNAGGLLARKKLDEMDEKFWDEVIALNLKSVFLVTKAVVPRIAAGS